MLNSLTKGLTREVVQTSSKGIRLRFGKNHRGVTLPRILEISRSNFN